MSGENEKPPTAGKTLNQIKKHNPGPFYAWPMGLWFCIFFIIPLVIIFVYSFLKKDPHGGVQLEFSLKAYSQMLNPKYGILVLRTVWITVIATVITIVLALPCGYAMARSKNQIVFLILIIIPFWTNLLIRIFAWMSILNNNGIINQIFLKLHLTETYVKMLYTQGAVILVSVYMYLPYAILPVFTAVDRFDFSLLEAARDLGAGKITAMWKVLLPGIKSGLISAFIFTFIPIFGAYTVPLLVGGKDSYMIGNVIVDQVNRIRNWPLAAAFSMIITLVSTVGVMLMLLTNKKEAELNKSSTKEDNYVGEKA